MTQVDETGVTEVTARWKFELVDLTRPISEASAYALWGDLAVERQWTRDITVTYMSDFAVANATSCQVSLPDHIATHLDAPVHTVDGGAFLENVDITHVIGEAVVLDLETGDRDYGYTAQDLADAKPEIQRHDIVLLYSGYRDASPTTRVHQSYLTPEAAEWLVSRGVKAVGCEPLGIEHIPDGYLVHRWPEKDTDDLPAWPAHQILLKNNVYIIEGLANLRLIRGKRVRFAALPLLFPGLSGCPVRAVAWLDK
jgi:kynurenine formamidase